MKNVTVYNVVASINNSEAIEIAKAAQTAKPTYKAAKIQEFTEGEADSVLVEKLSRQKRNVFLQVKHTTKNSTAAVAANVADNKPKRVRKPLEPDFGNAEVFICVAIESKTKYIVLSRIAVLSCFDHEAENLSLNSDLLKEAIQAYNSVETATERQRKAYNPFADVTKVEDVVKTVRQKEEIVQQRIDTKDERMQKREQRKQMLAERAQRREQRDVKKQMKELKKLLSKKHKTKLNAIRLAKRHAAKAAMQVQQQAQQAVVQVQ